MMNETSAKAEQGVFLDNFDNPAISEEDSLAYGLGQLDLVLSREAVDT